MLAPSVVGTAGAGNVGRDFAKIDAAVLDRILTIVKERSPGAEVASPGPAVAMGVLPGYARALAGVPSSREEFDAARLAREHGATHLLVPVITQWTEMRSGDPIGAVIVPHNRIAVTLRLMRLQPPEVAGIVTFTNHSRLTLNQGAARLLDDHFQQIVLRLLASG